jgi:hypothetical protein
LDQSQSTIPTNLSCSARRFRATFSRSMAAVSMSTTIVWPFRRARSSAPVPARSRYVGSAPSSSYNGRIYNGFSTTDIHIYIYICTTAFFGIYLFTTEKFTTNEFTTYGFKTIGFTTDILTDLFYNGRYYGLELKRIFTTNIHIYIYICATMFFQRIF